MPETTTSNSQSHLALSTCAKAIAKDAALSVDLDQSPTAIQLGLVCSISDIKNADKTRTVERGISDTIAVVAAHHDDLIHSTYKPTARLAQTLFNEMERLRCEATGAHNRLGIKCNLGTLWQYNFKPPYISDTDQLRIVFTYLTKVALKQPVNPTPAMQSVLSQWQETIWNSTSQLWPQLLATSADQSEYAQVSLAIIATINEDTSNQASGNQGGIPSSEEHQAANNEEPEDNSDADNKNLEAMEMRDNDQDKDSVLLADSTDTKFDDDNTQNKDAPVDADSESNGGTLQQSSAPYKSYSSSYDEIITADSLCTAPEQAALRLQLDEHINRHKKVVGKLSGQLQRALMAQQNRHWKFDLDEGVLDTSRLTRIITQPYTGLSFKHESDIEFKNTVVTLLVDNSKSMLGKPIAIAASCADILAQTLERCGVSVEILGFTTTELHGGALFNLWKKQGKASDPGRLNGLRHIVYKSADEPYRRARQRFGVMLNKEVLKQNIDGEALLWANERLQRRPEERKILLVISDGAPIDTSTMSANKDNYLIDHLHQVIARIEKNRSLQLAAIGIGHDVSAYYRNAITISDAKDLGKTLLSQLRGVIAPPDHKSRRRSAA